MTVLGSDRLILRPVESVDAEALHGIFTDECVRRFLWDDEIIPFETTRDLVKRSREQFAESRHGIWGIRSTKDDSLLGFAGYWYFRTPPSLEILFGLSPTCWGHGYATEASHLLLRHGFDDLGFDRVVGSTDAENTASIKVMERLGMTFDRRESIASLDTVFYSIVPSDLAV